MLHALAADHDVATVTLAPWSVDWVNAFYGTSIPSTITRHVVAPPLRWLDAMPEDAMARLRLCAALGHARALARGYDVLVCADNFAPFARRGIQYVHFPARLQPAPAKYPALVHAYFRFCNRLVGTAWEDAARNVTLANSQWTANGLAALGEIHPSDVLYPPVVDPGAGLPWAQRENVFLCIGRFTRSKRIDVAISIVDQARRAAIPDARLIIVGSAVDAAYTREIRTLAANCDWIDVREDLTRDELNALLGRSRYGVQPMVAEHFGMATAEMTRAGCLVFAHRSGGTPEVLDNNDRLLWTSEGEAVARIRALGVASSENDAARLSASLRVHAQQFSTEAFVEKFRKIIGQHHVS